MSLVDEIRRCAETFEASGVAFAYLFGSAARGLEHPRSDVDVAVYFSEDIPPEQRFDHQLGLMTVLKRLLFKEVDVVVLNDRTDELVQAVFENGVLIFDKDPEVRCKFRYRFLREYLDFLPYRQRHYEIVIERLKHGEDPTERAQRHQRAIEEVRRMYRNLEKHPR